MRLDSAEVCGVADRLTAAAELIDNAAANHLSRLAFGGACAGSAHTIRGEGLRAALDRLATDLARWSRATTEIAVALRSGAERCLDADRYAAARIA